MDRKTPHGESGHELIQALMRKTCYLHSCEDYFSGKYYLCRLNAGKVCTWIAQIL